MIKMKKNLILWRHAHAEIGNNDFNRHIDERGKKESIKKIKMYIRFEPVNI